VSIAETTVTDYGLGFGCAFLCCVFLVFTARLAWRHVDFCVVKIGELEERKGWKVERLGCVSVR
jgi:hypothetical protein